MSNLEKHVDSRREFTFVKASVFDNVGGEILQAVPSRAKAHSRFVICGGECPHPLFLLLIMNLGGADFE